MRAPPYAAPAKPPRDTVPGTPPHNATPGDPHDGPGADHHEGGGRPDGSSIQLTAAHLRPRDPRPDPPPRPRRRRPARPPPPLRQAPAWPRPPAPRRPRRASPAPQVAGDVANAYVILPYYDNSVRYVLGPADMKGDVVANTSVIAPTTGAATQVQVTFTSKGATEFDNIAAERYPFYREMSNPGSPGPGGDRPRRGRHLRPGHPGPELQRRGGDQRGPRPVHQRSGPDLSIQLKYGSLPVRFVPQSLQTVSATIGKDSLQAGLLAGVGGLIVVMIYMLLYYRALGLVVLAGLSFAAPSVLRSGGAEPEQRVRPDPRRGDRNHRLHRNHRLFVCRLFRAAQGRGASRSFGPQSTERSFHRAFRTVDR